MGIKKLKKNYLFFSLQILILIFLDQISKYFFTNKFYFQNFFINISFSKNTGSAFSLFSNINYYNLFIIVISIFIILLLIFNYNYFNQNYLYKFILIFLISGIIGNLIDRILFDYVRDFIFLKGFFIFNLADVYLNLAVLFYLIFEYKNNKNNKHANNNNNNNNNDNNFLKSKFKSN